VVDMTRLAILTFILGIIFILELGFLLWTQSVQIQKQQAQYQELRSYIDSHNSRLNILEQKPELVIEKFEDKRREG